MCGDDKVPLFLLIPNSAPQTSCTSLPRAPRVTLILATSVSFFSTENRTFGDHFIAPETKRIEIYSLFLSDLIYDENLCVIDSRQCCLSRARSRFDRSLRQSLFSRFNLYYLASAKVHLAIDSADRSHPYDSRSVKNVT